MNNQPLLQDPEFKALAADLINRKNLGTGGIILWILTVVIGAAGAIAGVGLFPAGNYPRIVLALPGIFAGGVVFFVGAVILFRTRKPKSSEPAQFEDQNLQ